MLSSVLGRLLLAERRCLTICGVKQCCRTIKLCRKIRFEQIFEWLCISCTPDVGRKWVARGLVAWGSLPAGLSHIQQDCVTHPAGLLHTRQDCVTHLAGLFHTWQDCHSPGSTVSHTRQDCYTPGRTVTHPAALCHTPGRTLLWLGEGRPGFLLTDSENG